MPEIIVTKDGSHSLLNTELNETYHSIHGALQESQHVFIQNGLEYVLAHQDLEAISIFEVGFGTGLNTLLTLQRALSAPNQIRYVTVEAFPIQEEVWSRLNYAAATELLQYFQKLHTGEWQTEHRILPNFTFQKINTTLQLLNLPFSEFNLIYFDAFAPNKQPEMWELPMLSKVVQTLKKGGILVTYCAKGQLKRDLKSLGLKVETLPGPPGKKEMVRARVPY